MKTIGDLMLKVLIVQLNEACKPLSGKDAMWREPLYLKYLKKGGRKKKVGNEMYITIMIVYLNVLKSVPCFISGWLHHPCAL